MYLLTAFLNNLLGEVDNSCKEGIMLNKINAMVVVTASEIQCGLALAVQGTVKRGTTGKTPKMMKCH